MVFSSHLFVFYFLPLALLLYYLVPGRGRHLLLTLVSFVFYGWTNPIFLALLLASTLIDYVCGLVLVMGLGRVDGEPPILVKGGPRTRHQKLALGVSIAANIALLGFFKYYNFAAASYDALVAWLGFPDARLESTLHVVLPLGISFYSFQSMSYAIDVYRGDARAMPNLIDFCCFESMFPQLVAGPIIRFSEVADQLRSRTHTLEKFARGAAFFGLGLAKKVLLANPCGKIADAAFAAGGIGAGDAWFGVTAYAFQIYYDFSGYSDMAVGLGLMMGFVFAKNFDSPYLAESITDFWRRWHLSLSTWLRDYLYVPLGGNRKGPGRTYVNLAATMLIGGLWHGAAWNFVVWGALHGAFLCGERAIGASPYRRLPRPARTLVTFGLVLFTWVFFRARDLEHALGYLGSMLGLVPAGPEAALLGGVLYEPYLVLSVLVAAGIAWLAPQAWDWTRTLTPARALGSVAALWLALVALTTQAFNPFIYFIF